MFGPVFGSPTRPAGRAFPTHFLTLWMTDLPSHHAGRIGDLGWALAWTLGAAAAAWAVMTAASRTAHAARRGRPGSARDQLNAAIRAGLTDWGRNRVLWVLLAAVPTVFIILDSRTADQRLALAGQRTGPLLAGRLTLIAAAALLATGVSLGVAATVANIGQWGGYVAASVLLALTYAMIGAVLGPLFGPVAGVLVAFLIPFLDLGIAQDPMLHATPPTWAHFLPAYGAFRILTDAILTHGFSSGAPLLIALTWLAGATVAAGLVFRRNLRTARASP